MKLTEIIKLVETNPYSALFYTPNIYKSAISYLFLNPIEIISVYRKEDIDYAFKIVHKLIDNGYYGYSLINYEAGFLFESKLSKLLLSEDKKLLQFFFFDSSNVRVIKSSEIKFDTIRDQQYYVSDFKLNRSKEQFISDIATIKKYIQAGDTYQVNYTVKGNFSFNGSYAAFFQNLLFNQSAKYPAFINNVDHFILSISPELFFHLKNEKIISQPMKGTSRRGYNHFSDKQIERELNANGKNRAENVMIVDLIRNDLGKVCKYGSIKVPELFHLEKYESLFQMTSKVEGKLKKNVNIGEVIRNIFPCGSVTGAPKIRTMEIISEVEREERGIYTGSIGLITPKEIKMNVAIRTITINKQSGNGVMGLGSGIVWDSEPLNEYDEVILKSNFLTKPLSNFEIFETMKFQNGKVKFINEHLARMKSAAEFFIFPFSLKKTKRLIKNSIAGLNPKQIKRVRVSLTKWGKVKIDINDFTESPQSVITVVSQDRINSKDRFRHFKTTNRKPYDEQYADFSAKGFFEVLYLNEQDELTEGSRTNVFLRKNKLWLTPPLESGALPGIFRQYLLNKLEKVVEKRFRIEDISSNDELILTNAVIGKVKVNRLVLAPNNYIDFKL